VLVFPLLLQTVISNQMRPQRLRGAKFHSRITLRLKRSDVTEIDYDYTVAKHMLPLLGQPVVSISYIATRQVWVNKLPMNSGAQLSFSFLFSFFVVLEVFT